MRNVLGSIVIHNYLQRDFALWFKEVRVAAGLALGKIVLHSVLLFLNLRARMEPLLRPRAVVSSLSKAYCALGQRAEIRTEDEFGVLARDLHIFLDRINRLISELNDVLQRVVAVNDDIVTVQGDLRGQRDRVVTGARRPERDAMLAAKREPRLSNGWFNSIRSSVQALDDRLGQAGDVPRADKFLETLCAVVASAETQLATSEKLFELLAAVGDNTENLKATMFEMARLEERMKMIIETDSTLVRRLQPEVGWQDKRSKQSHILLLQ
jgi:methyl-accepting chemotaxis protein